MTPAIAQNRSDERIERPATPALPPAARALGDAAGAASGSPEPSTVPAQSEGGFTTSVSVPTIVGVGSSMDEAALREVLTGGFAKHAEALATLNATSITIPEITMVFSVAAGGTNATSTVSYRDIEIKDVKAGVAASVSVGSTETESDGAKFSFGRMQAASFDLGGLLGLYGLASGPQGGGMRVMYRDFSFEGGTLDAGMVQCSFGKATTAEFSARPLAVSYQELLEAGEVLEAAGNTMPPEAMGTVVRFLADLFQAFQSTPLSLEGMSCTGTDETGKPFAASVGGISMEGYSPGIYPAITVTKLDISGGTEGSITLDSATLKAIDLNPTIAALPTDPDALTEQWFTTNGRKLIPAIAGFAFSGLKVDVQDPSIPGGRIQGGIANFDLTLGNYVNGIPTLVSTSASGIEVPLTDSTDPQVQALRALGIEKVNLGYELSAHWDAATETLSIDRAAVNGDNLGSVALALNMGAATAALFDLDPNVQTQAGMVVTIKDLSLDITDAGLGNIVLPIAAAEQRLDPQLFREQMAAGVEGLAVQTLGRNDQARALGTAIGDFLAGTKKSLSIRLTTKDPKGVPIAGLIETFEKAQNPMEMIPVLSALIDVTGTAR